MNPHANLQSIESLFDSPVGALKEQLERVRSEATSLWIPEVETAEPVQVARVVGKALSVVARAVEVLDVGSALYGDVADAEPPTRRDLTTSDRVPHGRESWTGDSVAELIARARFVLRHQGHRLCAPTEGVKAWFRLATAAASMRTVQKAFAGIIESMDRVVSPSTAMEPSSHTASQLADIRRRYVTFHSIVNLEGPPDARELVGRMRMIGIAIIRLLGPVGGTRPPASHRALLMIARILVRDWVLRGSGDEAHLAAGMRLFNGVSELARKLMQVNERRELVRYDVALVREVLADMPQLGEEWSDIECTYTLERLRAMLGRSGILDAIVSKTHLHASVDLVRGVLEDLGRNLASTVRLSDVPPPGNGLRTSETVRLRTAAVRAMA